MSRTDLFVPIISYFLKILGAYPVRLIFFILLIPSLALAEPVASLYSAQGNVEARSGSNWSGVNEGHQFQAQDAIRTNERSSAGVKFTDGFLVRLKELSTIEFSAPEKNQPISITEGVGYFFSRKPKRFPQVNTPQVSASVRGTEFVVEVTKDQTKITVLEGAVDASNQYGSVSLTKGELAITKTGSAPVKEIVIDPLDAVNWALYYPAVFSLADFKSFTQTANSDGLAALESGDFDKATSAFKGKSWQDAMGRSLAYYNKGDSYQAIKALDGTNANVSDYQLYKSALHLSLGETAQAKAILDNNDSPEALAQKSLIDLTLNKKEDAKQKSEQALKANPNSASARLVNSYVSQAYFDLDKSKADLEAILKQNPGDVNASTRLAEILLGMGETEQATKLAKQAVSKAPNNESALTVLGFAYLSRYLEKDAQAQFDKAISANQNYALAHLGRGLALIRAGQLEQGRGELEIATQLAPSSSLYRSYLGKAFFEEEKEDLSGQEYEQAIKLDPQDPTPYLYRSFLKLSQHKPLEALSDIEESIKRNDNRAVYRSKLLMDQDDAVRGASLGKVYNRVGFNELARVEAIKSLNSDYSNYSAHFLLSDLYKDTNLNTNAQVTQNLLGRLLAPVNYNSNDVDIVGGEASLNEYTALFNRPVSRTRLTGSAESASEEVAGGVDHTYASNKLGVKVGLTALDRNGFRDNDYKREKIAYAQGSYQLLENDTLIFDGVLRGNDQGDLEVNNSDPYAENVDQDTSLDSGLIRGGFHHKFAANSHLIGQAFYQGGSFDSSDPTNAGRIAGIEVTDNQSPINDLFFPFNFEGKGNVSHSTEIEQDLFRADLQYVHDTELVSFIVGTSARDEQFDSSESGTVVDARDPVNFLVGYPIASNAKVNEDSQNAYLYSKWHPIKTLNIDAGISYTNLKLGENPDSAPFTDETYRKDSFDPKVGLVYEATDELTLRAAYLQTLGRTERNGIGPLEPTFVGGFNQTIDGVNRGLDQELYALGFDLKLPEKTYFGSSYQFREATLKRDISVDYFSIENGELTTELDQIQINNSNEADEDRVSAYLYKVITDQINATANYDWENFDQINVLTDYKTNRMAFNLRYFDPSGFFAFGKSTWRSQDRTGQAVTDSSDSFWIWDAGVGYEFDSYHGFISLEFRNIFDQDFNYFLMRDEAFVIPEFGALLKASYNF